MLVELNKDEIATLIKDREPKYEQMTHPKIAPLGNYYDDSRDGFWIWCIDFEEKMTEEELWDLYNLLKGK